MNKLNYDDVEELYEFLYNKKIEEVMADVEYGWEQVIIDNIDADDIKMPEDSELKEEAKKWIKWDSGEEAYKVESYNSEDGLIIDEQRIKNRIQELNEDEYNEVLEYLIKKDSPEFLNYIESIRAIKMGN
jgi:hypothetical protein